MKRLQRKRTRGWRKPPNSVCCDRSSVFGNPFPHPDAAVSVRLYRLWLHGEWTRLTNALAQEHMAFHGPWLERRRDETMRRLPELYGKDLLCYCAPGATCHVDALIEFVRRRMVTEGVTP